MRECTEKAQSYTDNELNIVLHYNLQWFAADGEGGEKTEPATDKKLRDARDEGKVQVGWKVTTKPMAPKLDKFNPINGFKRIFSKDAIFELIKSVLKIGVILYMAYSSIKSHQNDIFILYELPLKRAVALVGDIIINTGLKISIVYLIVGIVDYIYNKHKFNEDMKMTKQEVKDEFKNTEGDPAIKGQQRKRMQEAAQRRICCNED